MRHTANAFRVLLVTVAACLLAGAAAQALWYLNDLSGVGHIAGIWMTLARALDGGTLYPPLEADGCYAGTRYMPVLFGLITGLARLTGDYLVSAKLAALLSFGLLLAGVFVASRRITGRTTAALVLTALVPALP